MKRPMRRWLSSVRPSTAPPPALGYGHDNRNRYVVAAFAWPVLRIFSVPAAVMGRRRRERTNRRARCYPPGATGAPSKFIGAHVVVEMGARYD